MSNESSQALKDVQIVMKEREEMVRVGQEILSMLGRYPYDSPRPDEVAIQKKLLEFMKHLSNIGGFCDSHWNRALFDIQSLLGLSTLTMAFDSTTPSYLVAFLPLALMIQVDFKKRPFRVVGFDIKAFRTRFRAILKRGT